LKNKRLTRNAARMIRGQEWDGIGRGKEGKYFERDISEAERSYSPTTEGEEDKENRNTDLFVNNDSLKSGKIVSMLDQESTRRSSRLS